MAQRFKLLTYFIFAITLAACSSEAAARYSVSYQANPSQQGLTAYITDYDTGEKLDSTLVGTDGLVTLAGDIATPTLARLILDGNRTGVFILEEGDITINPDTRIGQGTPLNDAFTHYASVCDSIEHLYDAAPADSAGIATREKLRKEYDIYNSTMLEANVSNPIGYYIFIQQAYEMDAPTLAAALKKMPQWASSQRLANLQASLQKASATAPGNKFQDFEVVYNDSTYRLSNYVGQDGKYLLVDFWASWCGPCIKETRTIKRILARDGKAFNVLGVAVWDEPENTLRAIKTHQLPWPQIINSRNIATDLYGISSIPHIMIIDPQGTIVSRGLQGAELEEEISRILNGPKDVKDEDIDPQPSQNQ